MTAGLHEFVRAGVLFETTGFKPVWFSFAGQKIKITEIHYTWTERRGDDLIYKFTVSDSVSFYELEFSSRSMRWHITAMD